LLRRQRELHAQATAAAPFADAPLATTSGRRQATELVSVNFEHIPKGLLVHQLIGIAACAGAERLIEYGLREPWELDAASIGCPVRVVWGTADKLLPWPDAAVRYREQWLARADWVVLDDVGHYPQFDVPLETAQLILGFAANG
jgi:pimeloyl-ACP methyl ester carboxylesterase